MRKLVGVALLLSCLLLITLTGACGILGGGSQNSAREQPTEARSTPTPTPTATNTPTPVPTNTPTPVPTDTPSPTNTPTQLTRSVGVMTPTSAARYLNAPTPKEADDVVHQWFEGVDADSPDQLRRVTSGDARKQTDNLISSVQSQADTNGVALDMRVPELTVTPESAQGKVRPVKTRFVVDVYADMGLAYVQARELRSTATFNVARLPDGTVKIVSIRGDLSKLSSK